MLKRRMSWSELDYGTAEEFPELWRAFNRGKYWFCENVMREMFFRSQSGSWFAEDPKRKRFFVETDLCFKLEHHYGLSYGCVFQKLSVENETKGIARDGMLQCNEWRLSDEFAVEPWIIIQSRNNINDGKCPLPRCASCPEIRIHGPLLNVNETKCFLEYPAASTAKHLNATDADDTISANHIKYLSEDECRSVYKEPIESSVKHGRKLKTNITQMASKYNASRERLDTVVESPDEAPYFHVDVGRESTEIKPSKDEATESDTDQNSQYSAIEVGDNHTVVEPIAQYCPGEFDSESTENEPSKDETTESDTDESNQYRASEICDNQTLVKSPDKAPCCPTESGSETNEIKFSKDGTTETGVERNSPYNGTEVGDKYRHSETVEYVNEDPNVFKQLRNREKSYSMTQERHESHNSFPGDVPLDSSPVLIRLIDTLKKAYGGKQNWLKKFPWVSVSKCTNPKFFFEFDMCPGSHRSEQKIGYIQDVCEQLKQKRKLLLSGPPGFGKSTICNLMVLAWIRGRHYLPFKLCFLFRCANASAEFSDIATLVISFCKYALSAMNVSEDLVVSTLKSVCSETLIIIDGVDEIPESQFREFRKSLKGDSTFRDWCILFTTRTVEGLNVCTDIVSDHVSINSLTYQRMEYLLKHVWNDRSTRIISLLPRLFEKGSRLSELTPLMLYYICFGNTCSCCETKQMNSTFDILKNMFHAINHFQVRLKYKMLKTFFLDSGKLFLKALVNGQNTFELEFLQSYFKEHTNLFLDLQILHKDRKASGDREIWRSSSHVITVFFATYYLRHIWNVNKRKQLYNLDSILCFGDCSTDVVVGRSSVYIVGLLPEIVLKYDSRMKLRHSTVEMYYDTERTECSHAFDSVNLLARVGNKRLERFGFQEITKNDVLYGETERRFEIILNTFCFDNSTVEYKLYSNGFENKYFMKVLVNSDDSEVVLRAVFRNRDNVKLDRIHVDFLFSYVDEVHDFLGSLLSSFIPDFRFTELEGAFDVGSFFYSLCSEILICPLSSKVLMSCNNDEGNGVKGCMFVIYSLDGKVQVDFTSPNDCHCQYDLSNLEKAKNTLVERVNSLCTSTSARNLWITVQLF